MLVIVGVIQIDLLMQERQVIHQQGSALGETGATGQAKVLTIETQQQRWKRGDEKDELNSRTDTSIG